MTPNEIRERFLAYFEGRDHRIVASSPVVPQADPTLLFTNAGMNQFKDLLLGNEKRDYSRASSCQKCIRAGGKHNDLDDVGRDIRHLTFFEMLGNWSFGDYYKRDAITWAWEFVTTVLELDTDRLYVTIYKDDDESHDIWVDEIGVDAERVLRLGDVDRGDEENFWSMGPTGPCGPCTEIHYDMHPEYGELEFVHGYDDDRVVEFWNLVFMEFNRDEAGALSPLPMKSVDTGMGLERVAMMVDGVNNIFHTELFLPIVKKTLELQGESTQQDWDEFFGRDSYTNYAVIADHTRSVLFALVDGARFSNEGRGSVLRSILRRAVRFGRQVGFDQPFVHEVSKAVVDNFGHIYPELKEMGERASEFIKVEEERFFRTIDRGIELFESVREELEAAGETTIDGEVVFKLHATFGFPPDLTQVMAEEHGLSLDWEGYSAAWAEHQQASKGKDMYANAAGVGDWVSVTEGSSSEFVGYESDEATSTVRKFRGLEDDMYEVVLDRTPFYAESGGQVGDTGMLESNDGGLRLRVEDTQKGSMGFVHTVRVETGKLDRSVGEIELNATIDVRRRRLIESNHTATHLLHEALRSCISEEIFQSGSLVAPDRLRFDFSYGSPVSSDELEELEDRVNRYIFQGHPVKYHPDVDREIAVEEMGAMAIFGEKYGDKVRVVEIGGTPSVELCGGTHVSNTRDINVFRITSESGVAAGVRRIEALTNAGAVESFNRDRKLLQDLTAVLKTDSKSLLDRARALTEERGELERRVDQLSQKLAAKESSNIADDAEDVEGLKVIAKRIDAQTRDQMLNYADSLRSKLDSGVVLLAATIDDKPALLCMVTDDAFKGRGLKAGDLINEAASYIGGRGGGRPTLAQAGGTDVDGLAGAVENFTRIVRKSLG